MDMRVEFKFLTPGMQHAEEADFLRRNALDHSIARPMAANLQNMRNRRGEFLFELQQAKRISAR